MLKLNIHEAKTHLSKYLEEVMKGKTIILCKRNVPIAEIRPIQKEKKKSKRVIGYYKDKFEIPDSFFDPLPEEILASFEGDI